MEKALDKNSLTDHDLSWFRPSSMMTMVIALFAAISGLLAGITANDVMVERTSEILTVERLQADRLTLELLNAKDEILEALDGKVVTDEAINKFRRLEDRIGALEREVENTESDVKGTLLAHELFAIAVTLFSLGITLSGLALVSRRKSLWLGGLVLGMGGGCLMGLGLLEMLTG